MDGYHDAYLIVVVLWFFYSWFKTDELFLALFASALMVIAIGILAPLTGIGYSFSENF